MGPDGLQSARNQAHGLNESFAIRVGVDGSHQSYIIHHQLYRHKLTTNNQEERQRQEAQRKKEDLRSRIKDVV